MSNTADSNPAAGQAPVRRSLLDPGDVSRAVTRIAHEIVERNQGLGDVVIVALQTGGVDLARSIGAALATIEPGSEVPIGTLDVALHRDDIGLRPVRSEAATDIPVSLDGRTVILVDDVIFTGRTVRAALDALSHYGRPGSVQLAVMIDRGHRELPIRPDFVGKNLPTARDEMVEVAEDGVWLIRGRA